MDRNVPKPKERSEQQQSMMSGKNTISKEQPMKVFQWFLEPQFYLIACIYLVSRLFLNVFQAYISFYSHYTIGLPETYVAVIPLVTFIAGFVNSAVVKFVTNKVGLKLGFIFSITLGVCTFFFLSYR